MQSVIHVDCSQFQCLRPMRGQRRKQRRGIDAAAQRDADAYFGIARQNFGQTLRKPPGTELLRRGVYSGVSENTPNDATFADRAARSSSRGIASS